MKITIEIDSKSEMEKLTALFEAFKISKVKGMSLLLWSKIEQFFLKFFSKMTSYGYAYAGKPILMSEF